MHLRDPAQWGSSNGSYTRPMFALRAVSTGMRFPFRWDSHENPVGMGTQICQNGNCNGKNTRDGGNWNGYFFHVCQNSHQSTRRECNPINCCNVASLLGEQYNFVSAAVQYWLRCSGWLAESSASSAASEHVFSAAGRLLEKRL